MTTCPAHGRATLCAVAAAVAAATTGCAPSATATAHTKPAAFDIDGLVKGIETGPRSADNTCATNSGTIHPGGHVDIRRFDGRLLSRGTLVFDGYVADHESIRECEYRFTITNVPGGETLYEVTVDSAGPLAADAADLQKPAVTIWFRFLGSANESPLQLTSG